MAIDLPSVSQEWDASVEPYLQAMAEVIAAAQRAANATKDAMHQVVAAAAEAQAAINALHGKDVTIGVDASAASAAAAAAAVEDLAGAETREAAAAGAAADAERGHAAAAADAARATFNLAEFNKVLGESYTAETAAAAALIGEANTLARTQALLASIDAGLAEEADRVAQATADMATGDAMAAQMARSLAEADAALAASEAVAADAARSQAAASVILAEANRMAGGSLVTLAAAGDQAAAAGRRAYTPWFLFGATWKTALHWIVAGGAEILAVTIPAIVALGAGLAVAAQGAQNVYQHMNALYTATEATSNVFHTTVGDALGLGHALQTAQDAANPGVYEILGSVINDLKGRMGGFAQAGLDVVHMFDAFAARVTLDLQGGMANQIHGLLAGMVTDLRMLGQIFGNLFHAILNLASSMPGLAQVLLAVANALSFVIRWASQAGMLITIAMGLEEMYRWGGLVVGVLVRLVGGLTLMNSLGATNFITRFGAGLIALVAQGGAFIVWLGTMVGRLAALIPAAEGAGAAMVTFGGEVRVAALEMSPLLVAAIAAAVAVLGFLAYKMATMKDATDKWVMSSQQAVQKASAMSVLPAIYSQLTQNTQRLAAASQRLNTDLANTHQTTGVVSRYMSGYSGVAMRASQDVSELDQNQQKLVGTAQTVGQNINFLSGRFHVSAATALELAQAAGVKLQDGLFKATSAGDLAVQMIKNLLTGMGAMQAPAGTLGNDMSVLGIQSQLASTKVQQLNQAWDAWIQSVTGGMSSMSQVETAIGTMANDAAASSASLSGAFSSIKLNTGGMKYTLQGFGQAAMQSWQQFTSAVQSGNSALDVLRTGMAEGVVSGNTFKSAVQGLVGQMAPFTQGNKAAVVMLDALAQEAGGPATTNLQTLEKWAGVTGTTARDKYAKAMETATIKMGNMSKVAQNLSAVVGQQLDQAFATAALKASGLDQAYAKYARDVASGHASQATLNQDLRNIHTDMGVLNTIMARGRGALAGFGRQAVTTGGQVHYTAQQVHALQREIDSMHGKTITIYVNTVQQRTIVGGQVRARGGHTVGAHGGMVGPYGISAQHGGILPGFMPGQDIIPAMLSPGEAILNPYATRLLGAPYIHALNRLAERGTVNPAALRTGGSPGLGGEPDRHGGQPIIVQVDGRELFRVMAQQGYKYNLRNSGRVNGLLSPS